MSGRLVDLIAFSFSDGSTAEFGRRGGSAKEPFFLAAGEHLVAVSGRRGDSLDGVQFHTSAGRASPYYGR